MRGREARVRRVGGGGDGFLWVAQEKLQRKCRCFSELVQRRREPGGERWADRCVPRPLCPPRSTRLGRASQHAGSFAAALSRLRAFPWNKSITIWCCAAHLAMNSGFGTDAKEHRSASAKSHTEQAQSAGQRAGSARAALEADIATHARATPCPEIRASATRLQDLNRLGSNSKCVNGVL